MFEILEKLEQINDPRQSGKTKHKLVDIVIIVFFAMLGNADDWEEIQIFALSYKGLLRKYIELPNGIPSHDTIQRVMAMIEPKTLEKLQHLWNEMLSTGEGEKLKKIINIDGKTMRSSATKGDHPFHVVSAWSKEDGVCFGQTVVKEKENEIVAIPQLLETLNIKGQIITIDAMGTQTKIADQIAKQKGEYVLAVKANQPNLYDDIVLYFNDKEFKKIIKSSKGYKKTVEKARGQIEKREYYQTLDVEWLRDESKWENLKSIGMVEKTIEKNGEISVDKRYYISSLMPDIELFSKAVRGHWAIESMHWQLDVTFREDYNATLDKNAAINLNILRKLCLSVLKLLNIGRKASAKHKRYAFCSNPAKFIDQLMSL